MLKTRSAALTVMASTLLIAAGSLAGTPLAPATSESRDSALDGVWVGLIQAKTATSTRAYPVLLNLDADETSVRGVALIANELAGNPTSVDYVALTSGSIRGKKIVLEVEVGSGAASATHQMILKLKKGRLKGKLTSTAAGIKKSKVELHPASLDNSLQQIWVGNLASGRFGSSRAADPLVALTVLANGRITGGGFVGSSFGTLSDADLADSRLSATLRTAAGDIDLLLDLSDGRLRGPLSGSVAGTADLLAAGIDSEPAVTRAEASGLSAGKNNEVALTGTSLAPGFLILTDVAGTYASVPEIQSAKKATVQLFVDPQVAPGTEVLLSIATARGARLDAGEPLETSGLAPISFNADLKPMLTARCTEIGCHVVPPNDDPNYGGQDAAAELDMATAPYGNLVNRPSTEQPDLLRVEPFAPERSYLIRKLRGDASISGDRMPQGGPYLTDDELAMFVRWIEAGAENQ